jgi:hypothetical protein
MVWVRKRTIPTDRRLSAKWLPTFADKGCHVIRVTNPYGRILGFLDRSRYPLLFYQVPPSDVLTRLSGPRSRPTTFFLVVPGIYPGPPDGFLIMKFHLSSCQIFCCRHKFYSRVSFTDTVCAVILGRMTHVCMFSIRVSVLNPPDSSLRYVRHVRFHKHVMRDGQVSALSRRRHVSNCTSFITVKWIYNSRQTSSSRSIKNPRKPAFPRNHFHNASTEKLQFLWCCASSIFWKIIYRELLWDASSDCGLQSVHL